MATLRGKVTRTKSGKLRYHSRFVVGNDGPGMYWVYRHKRARGLHFPHNWEYVGVYGAIVTAEEHARRLCPRGAEVYTEPSKELPRAFFGSVGGRGWSAMITTRDIFKA